MVREAEMNRQAKKSAACFASMVSLPLESTPATRSTFLRIAASRSVFRLVS